MTKEVPFVKKYVVRLDAAERARLQDMVSKGKHSARLQSRARILLKSDVGEAGEGWSDSAIARALDTSIATVERVRQQLVEEGFESILTRKHNPNSARKRIFDGEKEARLIALACSSPPAGRARWTLQLLEEKVVELAIVDRASDNTIGRVLKKHFEAASEPAMGHSSQVERGLRGGDGGHFGPLYATARPGTSTGLPGRIVQAADCRNPRANSGSTRMPSPARLRV